MKGGIKYNEKKKRWVARIQKNNAGKRSSKQKEFLTKEEAEVWLKKQSGDGQGVRMTKRYNSTNLGELLVECYLEGYAAGYNLRTKPLDEDLLALFMEKAQKLRKGDHVMATE